MAICRLTTIVSASASHAFSVVGGIVDRELSRLLSLGHLVQVVSDLIVAIEIMIDQQQNVVFLDLINAAVV